MSASASANDLGSMGAPSSDAALAPLIAALTANSDKLKISSDKLDSLQNVISVLSAGINSLRVGIERLTASLSKQPAKGLKRGQNLVPAEGASGNPAKNLPKGAWQSDYAPNVVFVEKAAKKRESEQQKAIKVETEANLKEIDDLNKLERKWLKREYDDRLNYQKKLQQKQQKALDAQENLKQSLAQEAAAIPSGSETGYGVDYVKKMMEEEAAAAKRLADAIAEVNKEAEDAANALAWMFGPTKAEFKSGKEAEKAEAVKLKAAQIELEAAHKALAAEMGKMKPGEYAGRSSTADVESQAYLNKLFEEEAAATKARIDAIAEVTAADKEFADELQKRIASDRAQNTTDRGGPGASPSGMGSFAGSPIAKAGMLLYSAVNMAVAGFNKLRSSVDALAKSAMTYAPGIAIAMERALKDLDAVVGAYSAKVGASMIPIVQIVSDYMFPTMKALGDAVAAVVKSFTPLVETIMMILMPVVTGLANIFTFLWKLLSPVIDILTTLFNTIGMSFAFLIGVVNGVIDALSAFFAPLFTVFDLFGEQLMLAAEVAKQFAIKITEWIPYIGAAVKEALKPSSTQGLAAASTARMTSAAAISETVAQNAFIASSGGKDPSKAFAQQMLDNDIPNKWAKDLDARGGKQGNPNVRKDDGFVGDGGGGDWNQGQPLHGRNNAPIRMGA